MFIKMMIITIDQLYCVQERMAIPVMEIYHYIIIGKP